MAARVSAEGAGPSYASVLNFRGGDNKENIEAPADEVPDTAPRQDNEEEEGFVPVISHGRRPGKGRRDRDRRAPPRPHKTPQQHSEQQSTSDQGQQSSESQPKKFVEAPIPKVNPWQVSPHFFSNLKITLLSVKCCIAVMFYIFYLYQLKYTCKTNYDIIFCHSLAFDCPTKYTLFSTKNLTHVNKHLSK